MASSVPRVCGHCNSIVPDGHYYCGRCGERYEDSISSGPQTLFYGAMQAPGRAKLILISGEAIEGMSYHLNATHHICGRASGVIPFEDPCISTNHADFFYIDNQLHLRDEGSLNGTFLRLRGTHTLQDGDHILAGDHYFRYEELEVAPTYETEDGTLFYASPAGELRFRLVEIIEDGVAGRSHASPNHEVAVGKDGCDLNFPGDIHISPRHFGVSYTDDEPVLHDLDSKNGTFVRIRDSVQLQHGDYVFIGRQLLRVEIAV